MGVVCVLTMLLLRPNRPKAVKDALGNGSRTDWTDSFGGKGDRKEYLP